MTLTRILASTALASALMFTNGILPTELQPATAAHAATTISFAVFYNDLSPHGDWVRLDGRYVFVPSGVRPGWRPYTVGHWVYGNTIGWTWASDEPFGWATYHYGRWGYNRDIGWYWVPGTLWAPAWVSWRRGGDVIAWAPLPPERNGSNVSISVSVGDIPDDYWVPVPARSFLDIDLRVRIIDDDARRRRILSDTRFLGAPRIRDRLVVNTVIDVNEVEKDTGRKVKQVPVGKTDSPERARASDEQVTVFEGKVRRDDKLKPRKVRDAAEIRQARMKAGAEPDAGVPSYSPDAIPNDVKDNGPKADQRRTETKRPAHKAAAADKTVKKDKKAKAAAKSANQKNKVRADRKSKAGTAQNSKRNKKNQCDPAVDANCGQ